MLTPYLMRIKDISKENRPRERFLKQGPEALSDAELFAILLRVGTRGKKGEEGENVTDMSNRLIKEYGLENLFQCSLKELQKIKGIGPDKAMQILAMFELGKRYAQSKKPLRKITCAEDVFNIFHERLKDEKQENFSILMLNNKNYIIGKELITKGILDSSIVHPREIFKPAIKNSASKIILIHNHPSGDPTPSESDRKLTDKLLETGELLDINIIDHIIIGDRKWWSWREER